MKAEELRIGNLVHDVLNNNAKRINQENLCDFANGYVSFEPIPLTEEWLLKFGFDETIVEGYPIYQSDKGFIVEYYKDESVFLILDFEVRIKYVHQLQNLYFALTGLELTIK